MLISCCSLLSLSQGHLLLIGVSGAGKTTLSRFVAWINGLSVFQIKVSLAISYWSVHSVLLLLLQVHNKYTAADFDEDLRSVLRRAGCKVSTCSFFHLQYVTFCSLG